MKWILGTEGSCINTTFGSGKKFALAKIGIRQIGQKLSKNWTNEMKHKAYIRIRQIHGLFWKTAVMKFAVMKLA